MLVAVGQAHPELLYAPGRSAEERTGYRTLLGYGLVAAAGLALFLSPFASKLPDGLDRVAENHGFIRAARHSWAAHTPLANYLLPGVSSPAVATALAGLLGTAVVFFLARWGSRWLISRDSAAFGPAE